MTDFKPGQLVRIQRPNKADHGELRCFVELAADPAFAWVAALDKKKPGQAVPPDKLRRQGDHPRKLYPLYQLLPHEPDLPR